MIDLISYKNNLIEGYNGLLESLPSNYALLAKLFVFSFLLAIYAIFMWKFSRFMSRRDVLKLNLSNYSRSKHPEARKTFAVFLYLLEYIIILPFVIFIWFIGLTAIILLASQDQAVIQVLTLAGAIVACIRIVSYYDEDLSRDIAKLFPLTLLAVFATQSQFFSIESLSTSVAQIPFNPTSLFYFLLFIGGLEIILRIFLLIFTKESPEFLKD